MQNIHYFKENPPKSWWRPIVATFLVFALCGGVGSIPISILISIFTKESLSQVTENSISGELGSLFGFGFALIGIIYWNKRMNKRPIAALGFTKENMSSQYSLGFLIGAISLSFLALVAMVLGSIQFKLNPLMNLGLIILLLLGFIIQGLTEEVLCRGYLQGSLSAIMDEKWAIIISAVFFAVLHGANPGIQVLPLINLFIFGLVFSLLYAYSENILFVGAAHSAWNFFQGPVFGVQVSGTESITSILKASIPQANLINGGSFGIEGSLLTTVFGIFCCALLYQLILNKRK